MKINKKTFVDSINKIEKQFEYDEKCHEAFSTILRNDYVTNYDYSIVLSGLIDLLIELTGDSKVDGWINYFIFDLNFGKDYKDGCITEKDKIIKLQNVDDLWKILNDD
jgi:hypothetical protein